MEKETKPATHQLVSLENRKLLKIEGVEKMISVKPDLVQLTSNLGNMVIQGSNLEIEKLNVGEKYLELKGEISGIKYVDGKKENVIKRIFK